MGRASNKHGLKGYIPSEIREKIRKDAGFGCVICGCVLCDYEHIEPEFHEAKIHDPERMTLLCIDCHGRVTRKIISKSKVWCAKKNPKSLQSGYVHDILYVNTDDMEIKIGSCSLKKSKIILSLYGKPIFWFEPPYLDGEPSKLCAIFYDENMKAVSYINRNQFIAFSDNQDIKSSSTNLFIKSNQQECLVIDREGDKSLHISKMLTRYLDIYLTIDNKNSLILKQEDFTLTLNGQHVEGCDVAFKVGEPKSTVKYQKIFASIKLAMVGSVKNVVNLRGDTVGWILYGEVYNKNYEIVGFVCGAKVFSVIGEFIGNLNGHHILYDEVCYEDGEPIYVSEENSVFYNNQCGRGYDVSFRLFSFYF